MAKFQHIFPISILRFMLDTTKIQLSDCTNIHDYCGKYQETYDAVCSFIGDNCKLPAKGAKMFLKAGFFTGMGDEYSSLISTIETE